MTFQNFLNDSFAGHAEDGTFDRNVCCPICRHDYTHIRKVFTRIGSDCYGRDSINLNGYEGTVVGGITTERRDALVIVFDGECGHSFEIVMQQHKGVNLVYGSQRWDYGQGSSENG